MAPDSRDVQFFVTGATGFIGRRLVHALLSRGSTVRVLVRDLRQAREFSSLGAECVVGDLRQPEGWRDALHGVRIVVHSAATLGPPSLPLDQFRAVNVAGAGALAESAARAGVARFVQVSSVAVTGGSPDGRPLEEDCACRPRGHYALSKWEAEAAVQDVLRGRVECVIARPAWVYGPDSASTRKLFRLLAAGRMPVIGGGRNRTQPVWVGDLIGGLLRCADTAATGVFHFAGPAALTTRTLLQIAAHAMGAREPQWNLPLPLARAAAAFCEGVLPVSLRRLPIDSSKVDFFQVEHVYSNSRSGQLLGWRPAMDWAEGAAEVARALLSENNAA